MTPEITSKNSVTNMQSGLSASILQKIENEHVGQTPKVAFLCIEWSIWALWILSIFIGALAFSMMIFFSLHAGFAFYEATHEKAFDFFMEVMPYAWVFVFVLMAVLAHYNLRHTKQGYKYQVWQVLLSSILLSFIGGVLLHGVGVGFVVDKFIAQRLPMVPALHTMEARMWQAPQDGRMLGHASSTQFDEHTLLFTDKEGVSWKLDTAELNPLELAALQSGETVRVVGLPGSSTEAFFHGCAVFGWKPEKNPSFGQLRKEREQFVERMKNHHEDILEEFIATGTIPQFITKPVCASHAAVLRFKN